MSNIKLFLTDVDGTLTDGGMYYTASGDVMKKFNARDGMGLQLLQRAEGRRHLLLTDPQLPGQFLPGEEAFEADSVDRFVKKILKNLKYHLDIDLRS